ncbi:MAG: tyrosine-protein phosphatase [Spirochaetales bacterium]|nr:tyrosine-protein phosphatase [Spirochaetales bacterium]
MNTFTKRILVSLLILVVALSAVTAQANKEKATYKVEVTNLEANEFTTKYGNLNTTGTAEEFTAKGYEWGDIAKVVFLDIKLSLPVIPTYSYVDTGEAAIIMLKDENGKPTGNLQLAINMGDFTTTYGIAKKTTNPDKTWYWTANEGVKLPMKVTFKMEEKGGYLDKFILHDLTRTNNRDDYKLLSDEEFANFRQVKTTGMGNNLYRSSNPINPEIGRNTQADKACRDAGITVAINLADNKALAEGRPEYSGSYYSTLNIKYLGLGVDFASEDFKKGLAEGLRFMAQNPGKYVVHCNEGKDRAGFAIAVLECLMGAKANEVLEDYMVTYYNYYGVEKGTDKYNAIAASNIVKTLQDAFQVKDFYSADLKKGAENYLHAIGLTDKEISELRKNL